jgi:hypothetical protein
VRLTVATGGKAEALRSLDRVELGTSASWVAARDGALPASSESNEHLA